MPDKPTATAGPAKSWDTYWQGAASAGAYSAGGIAHPAILEFWGRFFDAARQRQATPRLVDLASGNGAVIECALKVFDDAGADLTCVDVSAGAIRNIEARFPHVTGVVADAAKIPLDSSGFDLVTSQFGVEYAGREAVSEAARLVAPSGDLGFLLHARGGSIYRECSASLDAIRRTLECGFLPKAISMFEAGFAAVRGADRKPYDDAAAELNPAVAELERVIGQYGVHVAGDTLGRLYSDVARIHEGMQRYDPDEVLGWLRGMQGELEAFAGRMASMRDAALDESGFEEVRQRIESAGLEIVQADRLQDDATAEPIAWRLLARRGAGDRT